MREDEFYHSYVAPQLKRWGDHCRVENSVATGTPDVNYAIEGWHGWIENKVIHKGKLMFEKFQLPWLKHRGRHMGQQNLWVLAINEVKTIYLYRAAVIIQAPREVHRKWTVVKVEDIRPTVMGVRPWKEIYEALTGRLEDPQDSDG